MSLYQPGSLEISLIAINQAADLAASTVRSSIVVREASELSGRLPDISFEGAQKRAELGKKILTIIDTVDDEKLPHEFALTSKLLRYFADAWSKSADRYWLAIDLTNTLFYGPFAQTAYTGGFLYNALGRVVTDFAFKRDGDDDRYLALLSDIAHMTWQIRARTAGQAERSIRIHKLQLPAVRKLLTALRATVAASYPVKAERLASVSNADQVVAQIQRRIDQTVLPAFDTLDRELDADYKKKAPDGSVWTSCRAASRCMRIWCVCIPRWI